METSNVKCPHCGGNIARPEAEMPSDLDELISFWSTFPPASNEVAAAEIIKKLKEQREGTVTIPIDLARQLDKLCLQCCPWSNLAAEAGDRLASLLPQKGE